MSAEGVCAGASHRRNDGPVQVEADVQGLLRAFAELLKSNANDREPHLDKLMKKRDEGTLKKFLKSHTASECDNRGPVFLPMKEKFLFASRCAMHCGKKLLTIFPLFVRFFLDTCEA
jgi:hypothetical protein